jgi:hypothetical protein
MRTRLVVSWCVQLRWSLRNGSPILTRTCSRPKRRSDASNTISHGTALGGGAFLVLAFKSISPSSTRPTPLRAYAATPLVNNQCLPVTLQPLNFARASYSGSSQSESPNPNFGGSAESLPYPSDFLDTPSRDTSLAPLFRLDCRLFHNSRYQISMFMLGCVYPGWFAHVCIKRT